MITWEQRNQWLGQMRARIAAKVAGVQPRAGYGVVVQGDVISLDPVSSPPPPALRGWGIAVWAQVTMTQNYGTSEPGQVSDIFEYEPRLVTTLPSTLSQTDYYPGNSGVTMLPRIITNAPGPQAGEAYPGVVYQESVVVPAPSILDKFATITFYARGYWEEPVFADGFAVGRVRLTLRQHQYITTGDPLEVVPVIEESQVIATFAGASAIFTATTTDPFTPGDSTATINIIGAQRP